MAAEDGERLLWAQTLPHTTRKSEAAESETAESETPE